MSQKCIICGRAIGNYGIYCPKCQEELEKKIQKRDRFEEVYKSADFFERMKLKETKEALKERQNRLAQRPGSKR
jgi:predicted amidophosphoribosyltransferase